MVYCGKPSRACLQCRNRRLKCDLRQDSCSQCHRAHLACSGYRDVEQLRIRDQSESTIRRAASRRSRQASQLQTSPQKPLLPTLSERARKSFFLRYVSGSLKPYGFLEYVYSKDTPDEHLEASVDAISLAYLSHQTSSPAVLSEARLKYARALKLVTSALQSSELVKKDTTLIASLFLDIFEKITSGQINTHGTWLVHVTGALALLHARGAEQFADPVGIRMVIRIYMHIVVSFVACQTAIPPSVFIIRAYASKHIDTSDPKWRLKEVTVKYAAFSEDLRLGRLSNKGIIEAAMELDLRYLNLMYTMPSTWRFRKIKAVPGAEVFEDYFTLYPDYHITQVWNVFRTMRILLSSATQKALIADSHEDLPTFSEEERKARAEAALEITNTMAPQICASAPQYVRKFESSSSLNTMPLATLLNYQRIDGSVDCSMEYIQCYTILFPFYIAARYCCEARLQAWIFDQLAFIQDHFGMRNAVLVEDLLKQDADINPWNVYVMLGSYAYAA